MRVASEPPPCCARFTSTRPSRPRKGVGADAVFVASSGMDTTSGPDASPPACRKAWSVGRAIRCRGPASSTGLRWSPDPPGLLVVSGPSERGAAQAEPWSAGFRQGSPTPRAQPRRFGLARSVLHWSVRTPRAAERTHAPSGPPRGSGGRSLQPVASRRSRWRLWDGGRDASGTGSPREPRAWSAGNGGPSQRTLVWSNALKSSGTPVAPGTRPTTARGQRLAVTRVRLYGWGKL